MWVRCINVGWKSSIQIQPCSSNKDRSVFFFFVHFILQFCKWKVIKITLSLTWPRFKSLSFSPFLVSFRCFTLPRLSRRSWGRRRREGGKKRRGKKSGKALASPVPAPSYSTAPRCMWKAETERMEHTHSPQGVAWLVDSDDSEVQKARCSVDKKREQLTKM